MAGFDLNSLPDYFHEDADAPLYCTQAPPIGLPTSIEGVGESPNLVDGLVSSHAPEVLGVKFHVTLPTLSDATRTKPVAHATTTHGVAVTLPSGVGPLQVGDDPEVWSSPQ